MPERSNYRNNNWLDMQKDARKLVEKLKARAENARLKALEPRGGELPEEDE